MLIGLDLGIARPRGGGGGGSSLLNGLLYAWQLDSGAITQTDLVAGQVLTSSDGLKETTVGPTGDVAMLLETNQGNISHNAYDLGNVGPTVDSSYTVSIAFKEHATPRDSVIVSLPSPTHTLFDMHLSMAPLFRVAGRNDAGTYYFKDVSRTLDTNWHSFIGWRDADGDTINSQIDGGTVNTAAFPANQTLPVTITVALGSYRGAISRLYVWNRVLTVGERASIAAYARYPF